MSLGGYEIGLRASYAAVHQRLRNSTIPKPTPIYIPPPIVWEDIEPVLDEVSADAPAGSVAPRYERRGAAVLREVARKHGLTVSDLKGRARKKEFCLARHEAAFRLITECGYSYPQAGRLLGGRDHTTALHSARTFATTSPEAAEIWRQFKQMEEDRREAKRLQCIELHFVEGVALKTLSKRVGVETSTAAVWIMEETERRKGQTS
jgi:transposase-like protein